MQATNTNNLPVVAGVEVAVDRDGRYSLNSLHSAHLSANPDANKRGKRPADWLRLKSTKELIDEVSKSEGGRGVPLVASKPGRYGGTFAHELLAVSYAGWISPTFRIRVNQTFIDYKTGKLENRRNPVSIPVNSTDLASAARAWADQYENLQREAMTVEPDDKAIEQVKDEEWLRYVIGE